MMRNLASLALLLSLGLFGCDSSGTGLVSAVFVDGSSPDGLVSQGEAIILTFSEPVELQGSDRAGVVLAPSGHDLGFHRVVSGSEYTPPEGSRLELDGRHLVVVIEGGERRVVANGRFGRDADSTGVAVDFDQLNLTTADGRRLAGRSETIDLAIHEYDPAALVAAEWIDNDGSSSVSQGDELKLTWDRPVQIGDPIRRQRNEVPDDLFVFPVAGDRLDDGNARARVEQRTEDRSLYVVLGSSPRLSPSGKYESPVHEVGSPSGMAVRGTPIRRHLGILDALSRGVADSVAIDVAGGLRLFSPLFVPVGMRGPLVEHTATPLPGSQVLITGGMFAAPDHLRPRVFDHAYIFDLESGEWSAPLRMSQPRWGHTATYSSGRDGRRGTADDHVLIVGGYNDVKETLDSIEVIFPFADRPEFTEVKLEGSLLRRAQHTAHGLPTRLFGSSTGDRQVIGYVTLIGGYLDGALLNGVIEVLELAQDSSGQLDITVRPQERMNFARANHDSAVIEQPAGPVLFVYGGWGDEARRTHVNAAAWTCEPLAAPELFSLEERYDSDLGHPQLNLVRHRIPVTATPGERLDAVLIPMLEERANLLLVGGSDRSPVTDEELRTAYRIDIDLQRDPIVEYQRTDTMIAPRSDFAAAVLPNGRTLIVGGRADGVATRRVEVFDPNTNEFEIYGARLEQPRDRLTVTPLSEEDWIILGGAPGGEVYHWPEW